jgi:uncharacterized protein (DUF433 family)
MQLEDYFDFITADEIRLRGTRIGIEVILSEYLAGILPEEIALNYPPLTLEHVHASITYYLGNRTHLNQYLDRGIARGAAALKRQRDSNSELVERLSQARRDGTLV